MLVYHIWDVIRRKLGRLKFDLNSMLIFSLYVLYIYLFIPFITMQLFLHLSSSSLIHRYSLISSFSLNILSLFLQYTILPYLLSSFHICSLFSRILFNTLPVLSTHTYLDRWSGHIYLISYCFPLKKKFHFYLNLYRTE